MAALMCIMLGRGQWTPDAPEIPEPLPEEVPEPDVPPGLPTEEPPESPPGRPDENPAVPPPEIDSGQGRAAA